MLRTASVFEIIGVKYEAMKKTVKIDPRIFISAPFIACPKCKKNDCFGVLSIFACHYTRRCRECWFTDNYKLPELKKKIIYLDQFAISEMMKVINEKLGKKEKVDKFWIQLFECLERLVRLQMIICPDSSFHQSESELSKYYKSLKRMYEHFSHGATFYDPSTIRRFQVTDHFRRTIVKEMPRRPITSESVIYGDIHGWQDHLIISVEFKTSDKEIETARQSRLKVHQSIADLFAKWRTEKKKKFKDWYVAESIAWGKGMVKNYIDKVIRMHMYEQTGQQPTAEEAIRLVFGEESEIISSLARSYPDYQVTEESLKRAFTYLQSREFSELPFNKLSSLLWAAIAHQAAHGGRKNPPNAGMVNDIEMVSTLLPYCDAILVDSEMYGLLHQGEVRKEIEKYGTKILSIANRKEVSDYLEEVEKIATKEHVEKIKEVYGEDWARPFWEMYQHESE